MKPKTKLTFRNNKVNPISYEWDLFGLGDKIKRGDESFHFGKWTPVEKLNWVGKTLSNPHTFLRRKLTKAYIIRL